MLPKHLQPFSWDRAGSQAEVKLLTTLQNRSLSPVYRPFTRIVLDAVEPDFNLVLHGTARGWSPTRFLCIFLDGIDVHDPDKDQEQKQKLEELGHQVLRIPYKPPATPTMIRGFADQIEAKYREAMQP